MNHTNLERVLIISAAMIFGVALGIGLCKFVPGFWYFVNWGLGQ